MLPYIPFVTHENHHEQDSGSGQPQVMPVKTDEAISHPDLDADSQEFPGYSRYAMLRKADAAQGAQGRNGKIGRIGKGTQDEGWPGLMCRLSRAMKRLRATRRRALRRNT